MKLRFIKRFHLIGNQPGLSKYFGEESFGFSKFTGKSYCVDYIKTNEKSIFFITDVEFNVAPLYVFNTLELEAKLPIDFPLHLPESMLVLSESTELPDKEISYKFKYISPTEYFIQLENEIAIGHQKKMSNFRILKSKIG